MNAISKKGGKLSMKSIQIILKNILRKKLLP